ncbi:putative enzyme related to lactoylglutathione lyase [Okibacterium sp. HSC-33S16]|uniref:VOC family protein n=1 Tax=Okibacterium sp. HSC-33S16 TaxID=2910965 RepID=UPI00209FA5C6|nr:VOC family protein [Okibacterium sp. HSC-33S16]MCP2032972.1 putative enzyme related to lactoylglutathione lyase [Okibacterium sp. HSC-33S16]
MSVSGPGFISLQVRDLERSAAFYEAYLGFARQAGPPQAVVFDTRPASFAVREAMPGTDLSSVSQLGVGVSVWMHADAVQGIHDRLHGVGVPIISPLVSGPFGLTFTFEDPDGYRITLHDRA